MYEDRQNSITFSETVLAFPKHDSDQDNLTITMIYVAVKRTRKWNWNKSSKLNSPRSYDIILECIRKQSWIPPKKL